MSLLLFPGHGRAKSTNLMDHGKTWNKVNAPRKLWQSMWIKQLGLTVDGTFVLKSNEGSYTSTDGGKTWTQRDNKLTYANDIPGKNSLITHPSGMLLAFQRLNFEAPPSTWGQGGGDAWVDIFILPRFRAELA